MGAYEILSLANQSAQISLAAVQVAQLANITDHLARQAFVQQHQAALEQALFDVEQSVKRIQDALDRDPVGAGLAAKFKLTMAKGITPEMFIRIENKRAWQAACDSLEAIWAIVADDATAQRVATSFSMLHTFTESNFKERRDQIASNITRLDAQVLFGGLGVAACLAVIIWLGVTYEGSVCMLAFYIPLLAAMIKSIMHTAKSLAERSGWAKMRDELDSVVSEFEAWVLSPDGEELSTTMDRHPILAKC